MKFETLIEYSHQGVSSGYCMLLSVAILLPALYYAVWQLHFSQVLYHWHRKGSFVQQAQRVEELDKEIDWHEMRQDQQVIRQQAQIKT